QPETGTVPNIRGLTVRRALEVLARRGIVPVLKGQGTTIRDQKPGAGQPWPAEQQREGTDDVFILWLS
ncbi:MAG: PASTA domain-containing protein, partial [Proteobacteria bacterium]|nr:PASTA domain-containing protein [Pseudomonadota bacterium]